MGVTVSRRVALAAMVPLASHGASAFALRVGKDEAGRPEAWLQNEVLRVRYGWRKFKRDEGFITFAELTAAPGEDHANDRIDASANRGTIRSITAVRDEASVKTIRVEWNDLSGSNIAGIQEISIFPRTAHLKIDYILWPVNIVDIASPGGVTQGQYAIHGEDKWKRRTDVLYPKVYFDKCPTDVGHQNITEVDDPGSLALSGYFVVAVYNPANGRGFGRVVPVGSVDIIKLLHNRGFELFPYFRRDHARFSSLLFFSGGGREGLLAAGRQLARRGP